MTCAHLYSRYSVIYSLYSSNSNSILESLEYVGHRGETNSWWKFNDRPLTAGTNNHRKELVHEVAATLLRQSIKCSNVLHWMLLLLTRIAWPPWLRHFTTQPRKVHSGTSRTFYAQKSQIRALKKGKGFYIKNTNGC